MLVLGSVSSIFDFLTFGLLLWVFNATEMLFQTGWFMELLATRVLVIFVIRTRVKPTTQPAKSAPCRNLTYRCGCWSPVALYRDRPLVRFRPAAIDLSGGIRCHGRLLSRAG